MAHNNATPEWLAAVRIGIKKHWLKKFPTMEDRFFQYVEKGGPDECWEWIGFKNAKGYGVFGLHSHRRNVGAHRISYVLHSGKSIDEIDGLQVLHKCDNPPCVNPNHLFTGTNMDNVQDKIKKGRLPSHIGTNNPNRTLSEDDVRKIRKKYVPHKITHKILASEYGVTHHQIQLITSRKAWSHLT